MLIVTLTGEIDGVPFYIVAYRECVLSCKGIDFITAVEIARKERRDVHVDIRHWFVSDRQAKRDR